MEHQNQPEEIDLRMIFSSFRRGYHRLLVSFYRNLVFLFKNAIWIFLLLIIAFSVGWYLDSQKRTSYTGTAIVQINFESVNSVYEDIEMLKNKLKDGDSDFLEKNGLVVDGKRLISGIKIEPIADFEEIIFESDYYNDRYMHNIFENSKFDESLLTSEILNQKYKKHRVEIKSGYNDSEKVIQAVFAYMNSDELLNEIKEVRIVHTKYEIERNKQSIAAIDSILFALGTKPLSSGQNQIFFNHNQNTELNLLVESKTKLIEKNERLAVELLKYDQVVKLLSKAELVESTNLIKQKKIVFPIALAITLFILLSLRHLYLKGKRLHVQKQ